MNQPLWVATLSALLTPTIAIAGVYIGWQQWLTNRNKLKIDLFDRRLAFYNAAVDFLAGVSAASVLGEPEYRKYLQALHQSFFLVDDDLHNYLDLLYKKAVDMQACHERLQGLAAGEQQDKLFDKEHEILSWLRNQFTPLKERFKPLLTLNH